MTAELLLLLILSPFAFLLWAVTTIWVISEGVARGMTKYYSNRNNKKG